MNTLYVRCLNATTILEVLIYAFVYLRFVIHTSRKYCLPKETTKSVFWTN